MIDWPHSRKEILVQTSCRCDRNFLVVYAVPNPSQLFQLQLPSHLRPEQQVSLHSFPVMSRPPPFDFEHLEHHPEAKFSSITLFFFQVFLILLVFWGSPVVYFISEHLLAPLSRALQVAVLKLLSVLVQLLCAVWRRSSKHRDALAEPTMSPEDSIVDLIEGKADLPSNIPNLAIAVMHTPADLPIPASLRSASPNLLSIPQHTSPKQAMPDSGTLQENVQAPAAEMSSDLMQSGSMANEDDPKLVRARELKNLQAAGYVSKLLSCYTATVSLTTPPLPLPPSPLPMSLKPRHLTGLPARSERHVIHTRSATSPSESSPSGSSGAQSTPFSTKIPRRVGSVPTTGTLAPGGEPIRHAFHAPVIHTHSPGLASNAANFGVNISTPEPDKIFGGNEKELRDKVARLEEGLRLTLQQLQESNEREASVCQAALQDRAHFETLKQKHAHLVKTWPELTAKLWARIRKLEAQQTQKEQEYCLIMAQAEKLQDAIFVRWGKMLDQLKAKRDRILETLV